jgi:O-antigen/teichoic acid export membrane protein
MINKIKQLFLGKDELWTNIVKVITSSLLGTIISFALSPIITRLYSPASFGIYAVIFSVAAILSELASLKYERAILLPAENKDGITLFWISNLFIITISSVILITIFLFKTKLNAFLGLQNLTLLYFIPLACFALATSLTLVNLANRMKLYNEMNKNRIYVSLFTNILLIILGYYKFDEVGLLVGYSVATIFGSILLFTNMIKKVDGLFVFNLIDFIFLIKRYKTFPLYSLPTVGIQSLTSNIPNFFFSKAIGNVFLGNYNLSTRMVKAPLDIIGNSTRIVFDQTISHQYSRGLKHLDIFLNNFKRLVIIGILPILVILLYGPELFSIVFGTKWLEAGRISQILCPVFFFQFVTSPISGVIVIYEKLRILFVVQIIAFILLATTYSILMKYDSGYLNYLISYNIIYCLKYTFEFGYSYHIIKSSELK